MALSVSPSLRMLSPLAKSRSSRSIQSRKSNSSWLAGTAGWISTVLPESPGGHRDAYSTTVGSPLSSIRTATIASSLRSCRSVRSSRVSGSPRRCEWMQRSPRNRPAPPRTRLKSGSSILNESPTITYSTWPARLTSAPTCRPISNEISAIRRANSCETRRSRGTRRLYRFRRRRTWLALSP